MVLPMSKDIFDILKCKNSFLLHFWKIFRKMIFFPLDDAKVSTF